MQWLKRCTLLIAAAAAGQSADMNPLGISEFRIHQTASELHIVALDWGKAQVGELSLRVHDTGRNLTVEVRGEKAWHQSSGLAPLHLPLLSRKARGDLNAFLLDSHVSTALQKWGIAVGP